MSFTLVPPAAVAAGLLGLALTWTLHRSWHGAARDVTAWCLASVALGVASAAFVPAGALLAEPWRRFGIAGAAVAVVTVALAFFVFPRRPALARVGFALAATIAAIAVSALSDAVANKTDAVTLALLTFVAAFGAVLLRHIVLHRGAPTPLLPATIAGAGFLIASLLFARRLDPVLVADDGLPLAPLAPFQALVLGAAGGVALSVGRILARPGVPPLLLAAVAVAGYWRAGWYGVALAGVALSAIAAPLPRER